MTISKKINALVTMRISDSELARLQTRCRVKQAGWGTTGYRMNEDELINALQDTHLLLVGYEKVTARVIENSPSLQLIAVSRGNPANVDIQAAEKHHICVLHTPGRNAIAAAEYTMGLILSQARHITQAERALRSGKYLGNPAADFSTCDTSADVIWNLDGDNPYTRFSGNELLGKILGLIGFGHVAMQVAKYAQAFGMQVNVFSHKNDKKQAEEHGVCFVDWKTILAESDILSIHCKVTSKTTGMLDKKAFALMKPTAYLINTARACIVDQKALLDALEQKKIAGAAIDVFWYEPLPVNHPLLKMNNVTITPHLAGATAEVCNRHSKMIVDDVLCWLDGKTPCYVYKAPR